MYSVLYDIINCAQDLDTHCSLEDSLFVPAVQSLEEEIRERGDYMIVSEEDNMIEDDEKADILSQSEKEIVISIAKGYSNKEIADKLNISIHTVATHRRNISAKLQLTLLNYEKNQLSFLNMLSMLAMITTKLS